MGALSETTHTRHPVKHLQDVSQVRLIVGGLSRSAGANDAEAGRAEFAVTELATNLLRHAHEGGVILIRPLLTGPCRGIEILSVDKGPGMYGARSYIVGEPTDASGLASVLRLSNKFDIYSQVDKGTVVLSRHFFGEEPKPGDFDVGGVSVARPGESVSGDGWATRATDPFFSLLLVDGLGHGPGAHDAAQVAINVLANGDKGGIEGYVRHANAEMRKTRGGVLGLARIDLPEGRVQFVGVGNIEGKVFLPDRVVTLLSRNGTVGVSLNPPATRINPQPWAPGAVMILHSDGVRLDVAGLDRQDLFDCDPTIIAAVAFRDGFRGTDDATVVVVKDAREREREREREGERV